MIKNIPAHKPLVRNMLHLAVVYGIVQQQARERVAQQDQPKKTRKKK